MKKRVLIVSNHVAEEVLLFVLRRSSEDAEILFASHVRALAMLESEVPEIIIIDDYTEKGSLARSFQAYHEIKERLFPWQVLLRMGRESYQHRDYIKLPLGSASIKERNRFRITIKSLLAA